MNTWLSLIFVVSMIWVVALLVAGDHQMKLLKAFHHCRVSDPTFEDKRDKYLKFSKWLSRVEFMYMLFVILAIISFLKWGEVR